MVIAPRPLDGLAAVVTGSSRDMGAFIVRRLASLGANTVVHYNSASAAAQETVDAITSQGGKAISMQADLTQPSGGADLVQACVSKFGAIDIVVCNAGGFLKKPFTETTPEEFDDVFALNTKATFNCLSPALGHMTKKGFGRVVTFGAAGAEYPTRHKNLAAYAAAKAAVVALTRAVADEVAAMGITVNCVSPGVVSVNAPTRADAMAIEVKHTPVGHPGSFEDVADAVAFLVSPSASYITGAVLEVGGGWRV